MATIREYDMLDITIMGLTRPSGLYRRFSGDEGFLDVDDTQISRDGSEVNENDTDQLGREHHNKTGVQTAANNSKL